MYYLHKNIPDEYKFREVQDIIFQESKFIYDLLSDDEETEQIVESLKTNNIRYHKYNINELFDNFDKQDILVMYEGLTDDITKIDEDYLRFILFEHIEQQMTEDHEGGLNEIVATLMSTGQVIGGSIIGGIQANAIVKPVLDTAFDLLEKCKRKCFPTKAQSKQLKTLYKQKCVFECEAKNYKKISDTLKYKRTLQHKARNPAKFLQDLNKKISDYEMKYKDAILNQKNIDLQINKVIQQERIKQTEKQAKGLTQMQQQPQ